MSGQGKVFVASMNLRGSWAPCEENCKKLNVTSAQGKNNKNRLDFSPMTFVEGGYEDFGNFEAWWQSLKRFEGVKKEKVIDFWKNVSEKTGAKRRYPGSKGKKVICAELDGKKMDYVTSRKEAYVPCYFEMMKDKEMALYWKKEVENGKNVVVYDFDGPRNEDGSVTCLEVSLEMLQEKINYTRHPFGHGYIVAAWLKGIEPASYL